MASLKKRLRSRNQSRARNSSSISNPIDKEKETPDQEAEALHTHQHCNISTIINISSTTIIITATPDHPQMVRKVSSHSVYSILFRSSRQQFQLLNESEDFYSSFFFKNAVGTTSALDAAVDLVVDIVARNVLLNNHLPRDDLDH